MEENFEEEENDTFDVEELEYDNTARTQKINLNEYEEHKENANNRGKSKKEEGKFKQFIKKHKVLSIVIGLILLFALSLGGTLGVLSITNPAEVEMPNVVGMSKEEAQKEVEAAKLKFEIEKEEYSKDVPEGYVISQDPTYMERFNKVKEGSTVSVIISKGQEKVIVPNVKGKEKEEAIRLLEEAKLKAEVIEETSKTVKEGYVISQETAPDEEAVSGDTIKIHVSTGTGIKEVTVENVVGQDETTAKKNLENLGLKVNVVYDEDTAKDNGVVLKQSIDSGKKVNEGTTITITVNKLAEKKNATIYVNVKSLTGGYSETENSTETGKKKVKLRVEANGETIFNQEVDKNETQINTGNGKVVATGIVTVKVFIDDVKEKEKDIDIRTTTSYTFD